MRPRTLSSALLILLLAGGASACISDLFSPDSKPKGEDGKILFIGNSYLGWHDTPGLLRDLASKSGKKLLVDEYLVYGTTLDQFVEDPFAAAAIRKEEWDWVVLQGGALEAGYPDRRFPLIGWGHPVPPALAALRDTLTRSHPGARAVYVMPWAYEDGLTWIEGETDTYRDMQLAIREHTVRWADSLDVTLAPVGMAWYRLLGEDPPLHYLHTHDWNHPNLRGSLLSAATIYSTLFQESVEGFDYSAGLDAQEAAELMAVASRTVLDSLDLWNVR